YGHYDAKNDEIYADRYTIRFGAPFPTYLAFVEKQGEAGENNLLGVRALGEAHILGNLFHLVRSEQDVDADLQGWRDGTVRVIRNAKYSVRLPLGFKARGKVDVLF